MNDQEREDAARVQLEQAAASVAADEPVTLPPALTDDEREYLEARRTFDPTTVRALAWIDAATALIAELAAQSVLDGRRIAELERERDEVRGVIGGLVEERDAALGVELGSQSELAAANARIAELETRAEAEQAVLDACAAWFDGWSAQHGPCYALAPHPVQDGALWAAELARRGLR